MVMYCPLSMKYAITAKLAPVSHILFPLLHSASFLLISFFFLRLLREHA